MKKIIYRYSFLLFVSLFLINCRDDETADLSQLVTPAYREVALNGAPFALVLVGTPYTDAGATFTDSLTGESGSIEPFKNPVNPIPEVDVNTVGAYTIIYKTHNKYGFESSISRLVVVFDPNETPISDLDLSGAYVHDLGGREVTVTQIQPGLFYCDDLYGTYSIPIPLYFINYEEGLYVPEQIAPDLGPITGTGTVETDNGKYVLNFSELERLCCGLRPRVISQQ